MRAMDAQASANDLYRRIPSVNDVLRSESVESLLCSYSRDAVLMAVQRILAQLREEISGAAYAEEALMHRLETLPEAIAERLKMPVEFSLRRVINATGVILHTNLGRAPLSRQALDHLVEVALGYSNLEFDLETGERGSRDVHVESLLLSVLGEAANLAGFAGAHRAIVVNNCAAATYLVLHSLAKGKEVLVSRGELVEIGGGFRIPEILSASGAILTEVGTTNRTRLSDYEEALTLNTGLILRVHQSNFSMEGFVESPRLAELVALGKRANVPVFIDQGTGQLGSFFSSAGAAGGFTLAHCIAHGCDLVTVSGDKLLGGPQCGILAGKKDLVERIRKNPLFRTFRVDKLVYAALEATLAAYFSRQTEQIPILRMLDTPPEQIKQRCERVVEGINSRFSAIVVATESVIGGGTAPNAKLPSYAASLRCPGTDAPALLSALRRLDPPIIGRIQDEQVLLDLRTVEPEADSYLIAAINGIPSTTGEAAS